MSDRETVAVYDRKAAEYLETLATDRPDPWLDAFRAALPAGGRVLDLGCGPARVSAVLRDDGFVVEAVDASPEMVRIAKETFNIDVRLAQFDQIAGDAVYDGIWANFSLLHAAKAEFPVHLAALHKALKPGGRFHIGMKRGTGERRDALGRFYAYYEETELEDLLAAAGFVVDKVDLGQSKGLAGDVEPWIIVAAHA